MSPWALDRIRPRPGSKVFQIVAAALVALLVGLVAGHRLWPTRSLVQPSHGPSTSASSSQPCQNPGTAALGGSAGRPYHLGATNPIAVSFGQSRDVRTVTRTLALPTGARVGPGTSFVVSASDFIKGDGRVLDEAEVVASAKATGDGRHVKVTVCVNPKAGQEKATPGQYSGTINFDDPRIDADAVPGTITLKFAYPVFLLLWTLVVGAVALVWAVDITATDKPPLKLSTDRGSKQRAWKFNGRSLIAAAASVLATLPSVFVAQYVRNTAWGDSIEQWITYTIAVGGVVIATYPTLLRLINKGAAAPLEGRAIVGTDGSAVDEAT